MHGEKIKFATTLFLCAVLCDHAVYQTRSVRFGVSLPWELRRCNTGQLRARFYPAAQRTFHRRVSRLSEFLQNADFLCDKFPFLWA